MRFIMANDQRTIYAHYKYGQTRIGRKGDTRAEAAAAAAPTWAMSKLHLLSCQQINKSQNKELQMVQSRYVSFPFLFFASVAC